MSGTGFVNGSATSAAGIFPSGQLKSCGKASGSNPPGKQDEAATMSATRIRPAASRGTSTLPLPIFPLGERWNLKAMPVRNSVALKTMVSMGRSASRTSAKVQAPPSWAKKVSE